LPIRIITHCSFGAMDYRPAMDKGSLDSGVEQRQFNGTAASLLAAWCFFWLVFFVAKYINLTWQLCAELNGLQWALGISPCFWLWIGGFAFAVWILERSIRITHHRFEKRLGLNKAAILIASVPLVLWISFDNLFPYLYPASAGIVRLVPFIGGKGF